eukprot:scaffold9485_cov107-Cylindrotheca_fusiformis.AAC.2
MKRGDLCVVPSCAERRHGKTSSSSVFGYLASLKTGVGRSADTPQFGVVWDSVQQRIDMVARGMLVGHNNSTQAKSATSRSKSTGV